MILAALVLLIIAAGCIYGYCHMPSEYPFSCAVHELTGWYCPGCGAGRAFHAVLHGDLVEAFCYNPVMVILAPFLGLYVCARGIDWVLTGGNHIDHRISVRMLVVILAVVLIYGVIRNIPVYPFTLLAPGGLAGYLSV